MSKRRTKRKLTSATSARVESSEELDLKVIIEDLKDAGLTEEEIAANRVIISRILESGRLSLFNTCVKFKIADTRTSTINFKPTFDIMNLRPDRFLYQSYIPLKEYEIVGSPEVVPPEVYARAWSRVRKKGKTAKEIKKLVDEAKKKEIKKIYGTTFFKAGMTFSYKSEGGKKMQISIGHDGDGTLYASNMTPQLTWRELDKFFEYFKLDMNIINDYHIEDPDIKVGDNRRSTLLLSRLEVNNVCCKFNPKNSDIKIHIEDSYWTNRDWEMGNEYLTSLTTKKISSKDFPKLNLAPGSKITVSLYISGIIVLFGAKRTIDVLVVINNVLDEVDGFLRIRAEEENKILAKTRAQIAREEAIRATNLYALEVLSMKAKKKGEETRRRVEQEQAAIARALEEAAKERAVGGEVELPELTAPAEIYVDPGISALTSTLTLDELARIQAELEPHQFEYDDEYFY